MRFRWIRILLFALAAWAAASAALGRAARDHIRGTLGRLEPLALLAERVALRAAARQARFDPRLVSPLRSAERAGCRIALITGDADPETPVDGVRAIARFHPDLTVIRGAGHCEASNRFPGGWEAWARSRIKIWGL